MAGDLAEALSEYVEQRNFKGKGQLCVALIVTEHARKLGLPLDHQKLVTKSGAQVQGLGKGAVQKVLLRHGIDKTLAAEGGRTSRGSIAHMQEYVEFLNDLNRRVNADLDAIESFWIERVQDFFSSKPFKIKLDASTGLRHIVRDVLAQAVERQQSAPGMSYEGVVMQHLVGAKLECVLGQEKIEHNSASTADAPRGRKGDFAFGNVAIHVTTSPGDSVMERCQENIDAGIKPILVTKQDSVTHAESLARRNNLAKRIDVFEIEQFIALNLYELGEFVAKDRRTAVTLLVDRYNGIIEQVETDRSLRIEVL